MPSLINSDDGVVSGSAGLKTTGSNDGILALQNNGTTNVTVTAAGNVGIGTSTPAVKLNVADNSEAFRVTPASGTASTSACFATFRNNGRIFYIGNDSSTGASFGVADSSVMWNSAAAPLIFATSNTERARITSDGLFQFNSGYGSVATAYGCRAWVNFNGTGTPAIRASGNVSSITDIGTGRYTINITTAFPDANYSVVFGMNNAADATFIKLGNTLNGVATLTTTTVPFVSTYNYAAALVDYADIYVAIFR
jgi:hypothetical protein